MCCIVRWCSFIVSYLLIISVQCDVHCPCCFLDADWLWNSNWEYYCRWIILHDISCSDGTVQCYWLHFWYYLQVPRLVCCITMSHFIYWWWLHDMDCAYSSWTCLKIFLSIHWVTMQLPGMFFCTQSVKKITHIDFLSISLLNIDRFSKVLHPTFMHT